MAIGAVALWLAVRFDYRKLRRFSPLLLLVTFGLLFVVLVPGLGVHAMGSSRWVGFGQFRLQPSELMKLALTLFAADFIARRLDEDATDRRIIGPAAPGDRLRLRPDPGPARHGHRHGPRLSSRSPSCSSRACGSGPVMKVMAALVGLALIVAVASPYRRARLLSFLDPSAHGSGSGYQVVQSLIGLGSGHLVGVGHRRRAGAVGLPAQRAHRLHLLGHRRAARHRRRPVRPRPPRRASSGSASGRRCSRRTASARCSPSGSWPGWRRRRSSTSGRWWACCPVTGIPLPVHLLRRLVAGDHHGGGGHPDQRRPAGRGRGNAAGRRLGPPARPARLEVGERRGGAR